MLALLSLLLGAVIAIVLQPTVPQELARFVAVSVVVAIDAGLGGVRSWFETTFDDRIFVIAFVANLAAAVGIVWIGDQLATDLTTAIVAVFGIRIFQNLAAIRRKVLGG